MKITVKQYGRWLFSQLGMLAIATFLISFVFNYGYRYLVDKNINSIEFYAITGLLGLMVFVLFRREYLFPISYQFDEKAVVVQTALGVKRTYDLTKYSFVPTLHKTANFPEGKASLSFYIQEKSTGKNIRSYSWAGFSREDFISVSKLYGYQGNDDFKLKDFGKQK